jgi:hypothetical protein
MNTNCPRNPPSVVKIQAIVNILTSLHFFIFHLADDKFVLQMLFIVFLADRHLCFYGTAHAHQLVGMCAALWKPRWRPAGNTMNGRENKRHYLRRGKEKIRKMFTHFWFNNVFP